MNSIPISRLRSWTCTIIISILSGCSPVPSPTLIHQTFEEGVTNNLYIDGPDQLQPGQSQAFELLEYTGGPADPPAKEAQANWSADPQNLAEIDSRSGVLKVDESAPHGSIITLTAKIGDGKSILNKSILIYTLDENPLIGTWSEKMLITCDSYLNIPSDLEFGRSIRELIFKADGTYSVTWRPFERYHDYWGTYELKSPGDSLSLNNSGGNYVPRDFDGDGSISINAGGDLVMVDIWLGSPQGEEPPRQCGYVFTRQ